MNIEDFRVFCLSKPGVTDGFPFDQSTLVFKVMNKIFAITGLDAPEFRVNLKCDPERAIELREQYDFVLPGWHMNKQHWNTIAVEEGITDTLLIELTNHSYDLIVAGLPKKLKEELKKL